MVRHNLKWTNPWVGLLPHGRALLVWYLNQRGFKIKAECLNQDLKFTLNIYSQDTIFDCLETKWSWLQYCMKFSYSLANHVLFIYILFWLLLHYAPYPTGSKLQEGCKRWGNASEDETCTQPHYWHIHRQKRRPLLAECCHLSAHQHRCYSMEVLSLPACGVPWWPSKCTARLTPTHQPY